MIINLPYSNSFSLDISCLLSPSTFIFGSIISLITLSATLKYLSDSKKFFEWFRDAKIEETEANWFYTDLYTSLPYSIARYLNKFYSKFNIHIVKGPWKREY